MSRPSPGGGEESGPPSPGGPSGRRPPGDAPAGSYLGRRNPTIKLLALFVVIGALTAVFDPWTPAVFLGVALGVGRLAGGIPLRRLLRVLAVFLPALLGILLANLLFNRLNAASPPLFSLGPLDVTEPALRTAGSLGFRLLAFASLSAVFVMTTEPNDLILSLIHQLRLNYRVAFATMVGYRMLPLLRSELETIRVAHRVRGVDEPRGPLGLWRRSVRYALPLLTGAVRRGARVALAMDARAFGAFPERTYRRRMRVTPADWGFLAAVVAATLGLVAGLLALGVTRFGVG